MGEIEQASPLVIGAVFDEEDLEELRIPRDSIEYDALYLDKDEYSNFLHKLKDPIFLREFYVENERFFKNGYWRGITKNRFVEDVVSSAPGIIHDFIESCKNNGLSYHFEPLGKNDAKVRKQNAEGTGPHQLVKLKSKYGFIINKLAFRLYAIEIDTDCYIVTGGAIKIVQVMRDAPNTKREEQKIKYLEKLLNENGITSKAALLNFILS